MKRTTTDNSEVVLGFAAVLLLLSPICLFIRAFIFQVFAWNLGLVGLVDAAGGNVAKISYWTAFGALFLLGTVRNLFRPQSSVFQNSVGEAVKSATN